VNFAYNVIRAVATKREFCIIYCDFNYRFSSEWRTKRWKFRAAL